MKSSSEDTEYQKISSNQNDYQFSTPTEHPVSISVRLSDENRRSAMRSFIESLKSYRYALLVSQIISLLIATTGVTNSSLNDIGINIPAAQSAITYVLLALIYTPIWFFKIGDRTVFTRIVRTRWWKYFLIALADVEANYCIVMAYSLTIVTTIQIIDVFVVPAALILSYIFLKHIYGLNHIAGVVMCLVGCGFIVAGDYYVMPTNFSDHALRGDLLVLLSSMLYAISNVGAELLVKESSKLEYISLVGLFGFAISFFQVILLERNELSRVSFDNLQIWLLTLGYNGAMFVIYTLIPIALELSSATFLTVNLLTSDFFTVFYGIVIKKYKLDVFYFVGFFFITAGTILYCVRKIKIKTQQTLPSTNDPNQL